MKELKIMEQKFNDYINFTFLQTCPLNEKLTLKTISLILNSDLITKEVETTDLFAEITFYGTDKDGVRFRISEGYKKPIRKYNIIDIYQKIEKLLSNLIFRYLIQKEGMGLEMTFRIYLNK